MRQPTYLYIESISNMRQPTYLYIESILKIIEPDILYGMYSYNNRVCVGGGGCACVCLLAGLLLPSSCCPPLFLHIADANIVISTPPQVAPFPQNPSHCLIRSFLWWSAMIFNSFSPLISVRFFPQFSVKFSQLVPNLRARVSACHQPGFNQSL
jgi:hypothetical protein